MDGFVFDLICWLSVENQAPQQSPRGDSIMKPGTKVGWLGRFNNVMTSTVSEMSPPNGEVTVEDEDENRTLLEIEKVFTMDPHVPIGLALHVHHTKTPSDDYTSTNPVYVARNILETLRDLGRTDAINVRLVSYRGDGALPNTYHVRNLREIAPAIEACFNVIGGELFSLKYGKKA